MERVQTSLGSVPHGLLLLLPIVSVAMVIITYASLIFVAYSEDTYIGGIPFPYFSDTGRDKPAYYAFAICLTVAAMLYAILHILLCDLYLHIIDAIRFRDSDGAELTRKGCFSYTTIARAAGIFAVFSAPFLIMLACFDTAHHASVHLYSAYVFFAFNMFTVGLYTYLFWGLPEAAQSLGSTVTSILRTSRTMKTAFCAMFFVAFLLYIPIGLAVTCSAVRLTMTDCLGKERLGTSYCQDLAKPHEPNVTLLWDYTGCKGENTMRSVSQFFSILFLIGFSLSALCDFATCGRFPWVTEEESADAESAGVAEVGVVSPPAAG
eukprot:Hpha_TRINITY_DN12415_c0_g1::TRINITY_DN12415_c0_g1_i1::g.42658::m.42658